MKTIRLAVVALTVAAPMIPKCSNERPPGPDVSVVEIDCEHVAIAGVGFPVGVQVLVAYGSTGGAVPTKPNGTFDVVLHRTSWESWAGTNVIVELGSFQKIRHVEPCPQ